MSRREERLDSLRYRHTHRAWHRKDIAAVEVLVLLLLASSRLDCMAGTDAVVVVADKLDRELEHRRLHKLPSVVVEKTVKPDTPPEVGTLDFVVVAGNPMAVHRKDPAKGHTDRHIAHPRVLVKD
jgi:hypothetical protein